MQLAALLVADRKSATHEAAAARAFVAVRRAIRLRRGWARAGIIEVVVSAEVEAQRRGGATHLPGNGNMIDMNSVRPVPCFITVHTFEGRIELNTESLLPVIEKDVLDPASILSVLTVRLKNHGWITYSVADGAVESVFANAIQRITVTPE